MSTSISEEVVFAFQSIRKIDDVNTSELSALGTQIEAINMRAVLNAIEVIGKGGLLLMLVTIPIPSLSPSRFIRLLLSLLTCAVMLSALSSIFLTNNTVRAQQQQVTSQGTPITIIPGLTQNVLTIVSFLIGTSSFLLGLRIQNAARATTESTSSTPILPSAIMNKYFELLILALVIPSTIIDVYGILLVGSHLYPADAPYLILLFALFIPAGVVLFLVGKLRAPSLK